MPYILVTMLQIVSVFNVPLGQPIYSKAIYPNQALCQQYLNEFMQPYMNGPYKMSMEHVVHAQAKCFSPQEFEQTFGFSALPTAPPTPPITPSD